DSDSVPLKNWAPSPVHPKLDSLVANQDPTTGLVFIAISPCRIADTRPQPFGSNKTGAFGPPALVGQQTRAFPIPQSNCGIPSSAAYSLNFTSVTPIGQPVGYLSAFPTGQQVPNFPDTAVLNAPLGGMINNAVELAGGPDGGIQVYTTDKTDLVIDIN